MKQIWGVLIQNECNHIERTQRWRSADVTGVCTAWVAVPAVAVWSVWVEVHMHEITSSQQWAEATHSCQGLVGWREREREISHRMTSLSISWMFYMRPRCTSLFPFNLVIFSLFYFTINKSMKQLWFFFAFINYIFFISLLFLSLLVYILLSFPESICFSFFSMLHLFLLLMGFNCHPYLLLTFTFPSSK